MAQFASGSFTGSNGTELSAHDAAWTRHTSYAGNAQLVANRLRQTSVTTSAYWHSSTPASADYSVSADIFAKETNGGMCFTGVIGRVDTAANTFYMARYAGDLTDGWQLYKAVAGVFTQLGSTATQSLTDETAYNVKLEMIGSAIKLYKEGSGSATISATDAYITAAGKSGLRIGASGTVDDNSGVQLDNFSADDVTSSVAYTLTCAAGAYTYTGQAAALSVTHSLSCAAGSYSYSGVATTLTVAHNLVCDAGAYTYSGVSAALPVSRSLSCASGSYTYSGVAATLTVRHGLSCDAGSYTYAGVAATLTYIPGDGTVDYVLTCAAGAYAYSGQAATLSVNHSLTCAAGAYTYSGVSTSLQVDHRLTCDVGAYAYTGQNATLSVKHSLACATGSYDYIGNTATLDYLSGAASINYVLTCAAGAYTYAGQSATLTVVGSWAGEPFNFASPITMTFNFASPI